jgi:DNA-binding FadR family transcriptional regulator
MFRKAKQKRIFEDVILQIQDAILEGKLETGDKLPAERQLINTFGISRGTLREAFRVLEQKGLIYIKQGVDGGAIVKAVTISKVSESLGLLIRSHKISLSDLAEFRENIEGIVAGLAAERAKEEDIRYLKHLLIELGSYVKEGVSHWDAFIEVDNQWHMALAHITGNPLYESVLQTVHDNINSYYNQFLPKKEELMRKNYRDLSGILRAVEKRQASKARLLAQNHVSRFNRFMQKKKLKEREKRLNG